MPALCRLRIRHQALLCAILTGLLVQLILHFRAAGDLNHCMDRLEEVWVDNWGFPGESWD